MPIARLQASFTQSAIDKDNGIIRGVKVMELGAKATFKTTDGKVKTVTISPRHIDALLSHAGNRAIPSHWSHDWCGKETDALHDRVGMLKGFRKNDTGSLVADLHLGPGQYRDKALWSAEQEPENIMLSAVYGYSKFDADCIPSSFEACDLVANGAATYSLLSKANPDNENDMTKEEIEKMLDEKLTAAFAKFTPKAPEGVITKEELTAALAAHKLTDAERNEIALLSASKAKAELVGEVGRVGLVQTFGNGPTENEFETAVTAQLSAGAKDRTIAIMRLAKDKPGLYNDAVAAGKI